MLGVESECWDIFHFITSIISLPPFCYHFSLVCMHFQRCAFYYGLSVSFLALTHTTIMLLS